MAFVEQNDMLNIGDAFHRRCEDKREQEDITPHSSWHFVDRLEGPCRCLTGRLCKELSTISSEYLVGASLESG